MNILRNDSDDEYEIQMGLEETIKQNANKAEYQMNNNKKVTFTFTASIPYETTEELDITKDEYNKMTDSEKEKLHREIEDEWLHELCCDARTSTNFGASYKIMIDHTDEEIYQY